MCARSAQMEACAAMLYVSDQPVFSIAASLVFFRCAVTRNVRCVALRCVVSRRQEHAKSPGVWGRRARHHVQVFPFPLPGALCPLRCAV